MQANLLLQDIRVRGSRFVSSNGSSSYLQNGLENQPRQWKGRYMLLRTKTYLLQLQGWKCVLYGTIQLHALELRCSATRSLCERFEGRGELV